MTSHKHTLLHGLLICVSLLGACGNDPEGDPTEYEEVNTVDGIAMEVKEETVSPEGLTVVVENESIEEAIYGDDFVLERMIEGNWYQMTTLLEEENYGFNAIGYSLIPGESGEWEVNWEWLYGSLERGEYRIIKGVLDFREAGNFDEYYLAAEFVIETN